MAIINSVLIFVHLTQLYISSENHTYALNVSMTTPSIQNKLKVIRYYYRFFASIPTSSRWTKDDASWTTAYSTVGWSITAFNVLSILQTMRCSGLEEKNIEIWCWLELYRLCNYNAHVYHPVHTVKRLIIEPDARQGCEVDQFFSVGYVRNTAVTVKYICTTQT